MEQQTDVHKVRHELWKRLVALSSTLEAFEYAAEYNMNGGVSRIDPISMFSQCNLAMEKIIDLFQDLDQEIQKLP